MPCWAASNYKRKTLEVVIQMRAGREPLPFLIMELGNTVEDLEGRAICCESFFFFIEINADISLGMDSNYTLITLFRLVFCTHYHYIHGEFRSLKYFVNSLMEAWVFCVLCCCFAEESERGGEYL